MAPKTQFPMHFGMLFDSQNILCLAFCAAVEDKYQVVDFCPDKTGLRVEELED